MTSGGEGAGDRPSSQGTWSDHLGHRFEFISKLGAGGMGDVYAVRDRELDEVVALKLLSGDALATDELLKRLRREVRVARQIISPRVCRVHDLVELPSGGRGITMALLSGDTLRRRIRHTPATEWTRAARWAADIAEGLAAAHALGIVHRDLKPDNVMIVADERAVVLDFGVAYQPVRVGDPKITASDVVVGTLLYMAPEQLTNAPLDPRCDLYALGLVLAETLSGTVPFSGATYAEILNARVVKSKPYAGAELPAETPQRLRAMIATLLTHDRDGRPDSALRVRDALLDIAERGDASSGWVPDTLPDAPTPAVPDTQALPSRPVTRGRGPLLGLAAVVVGAGIGGVVLRGGASRDTSPGARPTPSLVASSTVSARAPPVTDAPSPTVAAPPPSWSASPSLPAPTAPPSETARPLPADLPDPEPM